jgi:hypothetical protein
MTTALTTSAQRSRAAELIEFDGVASRRELAAAGITVNAVDAQLAAGRWRRVGPAIVLHNGPLTRGQRERVALINCGPRSVLTSFTAAQRCGLQGWERNEIHVLGPQGARIPRMSGVVLHRTGDWQAADVVPSRSLHRLAPALLIATASFASTRPAYGLLAAAVQQRLVTARDLDQAIAASPRTRHRASLQLAVNDIAQGAHALSEIDFIRLCARNGLPRPRQQAVRVMPNGQRRYLDAEWELPDGRLVAVEVDGALHLVPRRWIEDQLRQNEVVIGGTLLLRYPSIVVRDDEPIVVDQLRRALLVP